MGAVSGADAAVAEVADIKHPRLRHTAAGSLTAALASDAVLDAASAWVCRRRRDWPADADIWSFRRNWRDEKERLKDALLSGRFRFGLLQRVTKADGGEADLWSARDALVLKALTLVLARVLPVSPRCTHINGNGGAKAAVRDVRAALATNRFVLRTDVKSYYASIDHLLLMDRLARWIRDPAFSTCSVSICVAPPKAAVGSGIASAGFRSAVR
jgi:RNA-directed DNA polymerase